MKSKFYKLCQIINSIITPNDLIKNIPQIEKKYCETFNRRLNLKKINSFNSYIQSTKLNKKNEQLWFLIDKYEVRKHIASTIGEKYLSQLLGVWDNTHEIDYNTLPSQFILKTTHGSNWNILVKDSHQFNRAEANQLLEKWLQTNFFDITAEPHYRKIKPRIIAEEYLCDSNGELLDYKFFCFHGQPLFVQVDIGRYTPHHSRLYFDLHWRQLGFTIGDYPISQRKLAKPLNWEEMLLIVKPLAKDHEHVRVDLYNIDGRIIFGELTFTHESGLKKFHPESYDFLIGNILKNKRINHSLREKFLAQASSFNTH